MNLLYSLITFIFIFTSLCFSYPTAISTIEPVGESEAFGEVVFYSKSNDSVRVLVNLYKVPDGLHGLHVHLYGDITDKEAANAAGGHYAGIGSENHGCPNSPVRHEGDMGNWTSVNGRIFGTKDLDLLQLQGFYSIVGRSVILHELPDDCTGTSGNAGSRIGQGVIGISSYGDDNTASSEYNEVKYAVASLQPTSYCNDQCKGTVWFTKLDETQVLVTARVEGLKVDTVHGFHIHEFGDLSNITGTSAGAHYNPSGANHGLPPNKPRHVGDLGNLQNYDSDSVGWYQYKTDYLSPFEHILGRSVVVHELNDHGAGEGCSSSGNAGNRLLFGTIGVTSSDQTPEVPISIDNTWEDIDCSSNQNPILVGN